MTRIQHLLAHTYLRAYEQWAPTVARVVLGGMFLMGAYLKLPWKENFHGEVAMTAAAGVPLPTLAVLLAFVIELVGGLMVALGWHARIAAAALAALTLVFAFVFYTNFSNPQILGLFNLHLTLIAGLLYVSVYGARHFALREDA